MADLAGQKGELRLTVEVKRAATGKTETFELVGMATLEELEKLLAEEKLEKEAQNG